MIIKKNVMKVLRNIKLLLLIAFISVGLNLSAQDFSAIAESLGKGDVVSLSTHFDSNPELTILENEAIYSKSQIETILKNFFSKNKPLAYDAIHYGNSGNGAFLAMSWNIAKYPGALVSISFGSRPLKGQINSLPEV